MVEAKNRCLKRVRKHSSTTLRVLNVLFLRMSR